MLFDAIERRRCVGIRYRGGPRIVEPHGCETSRRGRRVLRGYQFGGFSQSAVCGWKLFFVDQIEDVWVLEETFAPRPS